MGAAVEMLVAGELLVVVVVVLVVEEGVGAVVGMAVVMVRDESEAERSFPGMKAEGEGKRAGPGRRMGERCSEENPRYLKCRAVCFVRIPCGSYTVYGEQIRVTVTSPPYTQKKQTAQCKTKKTTKKTTTKISGSRHGLPQ